MSEITDPRTLLDEAPMSRAQVAALALVGALSALDGYDVLAVSFAAPGISQEWGLGKAALGLVLSSGLVGMALGSLIVAPLADRFGRRRLVIANLLLMALGMLLSAFAQSIEVLAVCRMVTGIGIGAMVPVITPYAAELSNTRRRGLAMAVLSVGFPIGGTVGGFTAAMLLHWLDWTAVFLFGAFIALILLPLVIVGLPESLAFLMERREARSLERVNALLRRFHCGVVAALPPATPKQAAPYREIFRPAQRARTLRITTVNLLYLVTVYYVLSWLPQMIADSGFSASTGSALSALANMVGVVACFAAGLAATRLRLRSLGAAMMIGLSLATIAFGYTPPSLPLLATMAGITGLFLYSGILGLYTTIVETFEPASRATGVGFVMGVGRASAALGPALAGALFGLGAGRGAVSAAMAGASLVAGLLILLQDYRAR